MPFLLNPKNSPTPLIQSSVAQYIAPSGAFGPNGALTLGTALSRAFTEGLYFYFPANAVYAGSAAGWYWTVMSTTTAATVYADTFAAAINTSPQRVTAPTPIIAAGPGAYTGAVGEIDFLSATVTAGSLGPSGILNGLPRIATNNSAGTKALRAYLGGTLISTASISTQVVAKLLFEFSNRGAENLNTSCNFINNFSATAYQSVYSNIDTSVNTVFKFTGQHSTASDYFGLEQCNIFLTAGD